MPALFDIGKTPGTAMAGNDGTKIVHAETFSSARSVASVSLVSVLSAAYTIPANLLGVGDQIVFEGAFTINNTAGANRTYSLNIGPFMTTDHASSGAQATATARLYMWRLVTTIVSASAQATQGRLIQSSAGTAGSVFDIAFDKLWNATSVVTTSAATTYDVKVLSSSATGTQEASLVSASVLHIPKRDWTY